MPLALVTGASRGIGRAITLDLAKAGYDVIINFASRTEAAEETAAKVRELGRVAHLAPFDVGAGKAAEEATDALLATHGCPDALINNAGITRDGMFGMMSRASWQSVLDINLGSFYSVTRPVARQMLRRRAGRIVTIASLSGQRGNAGQVNYAAAKAGLVGATKALALELAPRSITVNAVAPGLIKTEMTANIPADKLVAFIPMGRLGTAEEVAQVVTFLCSPGASYITGQVIDVNGGMYT